MFFVVSLDGENAKEKRVVPATWLNKTDTLCLMPPVMASKEVERLAETNASPAKGWGMNTVTCLAKFGTYAEAKKHLEMAANSKETKDPPKKKRRAALNNHLVNHASTFDADFVEVHDNKDDSTEDDSLMEEDIAANPVIVKIEPSSPSHRRSKSSNVRLSDLNLTSFLSPESPDRSSSAVEFLMNDSSLIEVSCSCGSACHRLMLQRMAQIRREVEGNARLLRQLVTRSTKPQNGTVVVPSCTLPPDFPIELPAKEIRDIEQLDDYLQDGIHFALTLPYFTSVGGNNVKQTLKNVMKKLIREELGLHFNWKGRGEKKPFYAYTRIHSLIFNAVKANPKSQGVMLSDVEKHIKNWLRYAPAVLEYKKSSMKRKMVMAQVEERI